MKSKLRLLEITIFGLIGVSIILVGLNQEAYALSTVVASWTFDNGNSTIAKDVSGNGNNGKIIGATVVNGKIGKALSFDGVDDVVSVPNSSTLNFGSTGSFAISLWMKSTQSGTGETGYGLIVDKRRNNDGVYRGYSIEDNSGMLIGRIRDGSAHDVPVYSTSNVNDGNFHHIVFIVDRSTQTEKLYVDDHLDSSANIASVGNIDTLFSLNLGGTTAPNTLVDFFNGTIDEVSIYKEPLKPAQIHYLFSTGH